MLAKGRASVLFAAVSYCVGRWWISLSVEFAGLPAAHRHPVRDPTDRGGWVGIDRGLSAFVVAATADGREVAHIDNPPKVLVYSMRRQRRLARSLSRKREGSNNRRNEAARLGRHHHRIGNIRLRFLRRVFNKLVKTHGRPVLESFNVTGMLANHYLAQSDQRRRVAVFARQPPYKATWHRGMVEKADRWYSSSKKCSICGRLNHDLKLAHRVFTCTIGHQLDRDLNAAINLATRAKAHDKPRTPKHRGRGDRCLLTGWR